MGESIKIVDLAHKMIQMAGLQPDHDIKIKYTGQRPGEKLHEELFNKHEKLLSTNHKGVMLASPIVYDYQMLYDAFKEIEKTSRQRLTKDTLVLLKALVPEYNPVTVCQHDKTIH
jgi:FlaA1/EpsC-like NDP-sugar epimerase